jgi:hypothetical protein
MWARGEALLMPMFMAAGAKAMECLLRDANRWFSAVHRIGFGLPDIGNTEIPGLVTAITAANRLALHCTTARFTPPRLDHENFVVCCPLALLGNAFYPILVHRLAASIHASSTHSVTLMKLRFTSFVVINLG